MSKIRSWCERCKEYLFAGANTHLIAALCLMVLAVFFIIGLFWYRSLGVRDALKVTDQACSLNDRDCQGQSEVPEVKQEVGPAHDLEKMKRELRISDRRIEDSMPVVAPQEENRQPGQIKTLIEKKSPQERGRPQGRQPRASGRENRRPARARSQSARYRNQEKRKIPAGKRGRMSQEEIRKKVAAEVAQRAAAIPIGEIGEGQPERLVNGK